jgi:FkbM family methyltransferase
MNLFFELYAKLFARPFFLKLNKLLYHLGLRGLGVLNYKSHLSGERYWLERYLKDKNSPVVFDVGANVGEYSKNVMEFNPTSIVFAFEPHPETYKKLISSISETGRLKSSNVGVGDKKGYFNLYDYSDNDGSAHASFYKEIISELHKGKPVFHRVEVVKLDDVIDQESISDLDLLKIDTEGNEYSVLKGAIDSIGKNKIKAIHFEFNEMNIFSGVTFKMFWDLLAQYDFYRILPDGNLVNIKNYSPIHCEIYAYQNIVCLLK